MSKTLTNKLYLPNNSAITRDSTRMVERKHIKILPIRTLHTVLIICRHKHSQVKILPREKKNKEHFPIFCIPSKNRINTQNILAFYFLRRNFNKLTVNHRE